MIPENRKYLQNDLYLYIYMAHKRAVEKTGYDMKIFLYKDYANKDVKSKIIIIDEIEFIPNNYKTGYIETVIIKLDLYAKLSDRTQLSYFNSVFLEELMKTTLTPNNIEISYNYKGQNLIKGIFNSSTIDITKDKPYNRDRIELELNCIYK